MFLKFTISKDSEQQPQEKFHPVKDLEEARKFVYYLMDNQPKGKTYSDFSVVDDSKQKVIKAYDKKQLLRERPSFGNP